jgi:ribosomal-protein-alanine N-acetyltransferase
MSIYLRRINLEDIDFIYRGLSDPAVIKYYGVSFKTLEETKEQMDWYADLETSATGKWWLICDSSTDIAVGAGGFNDWSKQNQKAEIGFWLLPEYWGKGYMSSAIPFLLHEAFNKMELNRIEAYVESNNMNCKKALLKMGFNYESTLKKYEFKYGEYIDIEIYTFLRANFINS